LTAHAVAKTKWPVSSPSVKICKIFTSSLNFPTYRDFMIKKSLKSKRSKSHTWAPLRWIRFPFFKMRAWFCIKGRRMKVPYQREEDKVTCLDE
jgi:hypothetical protein